VLVRSSLGALEIARRVWRDIKYTRIIFKLVKFCAHVH